MIVDASLHTTSSSLEFTCFVVVMASVLLVALSALHKATFKLGGTDSDVIWSVSAFGGILQMKYSLVFFFLFLCTHCTIDLICTVATLLYKSTFTVQRLHL